MRILMFSLHELPNSCANSTRIINFAKLLKQLGHEVAVVGVTNRNDIPLQGIYEDIAYQMFQYKPYYGYRVYRRVEAMKKEIVDFLQDKQYDAIILSEVYLEYAKLFWNYSKKTGTKLIVNAVEWYAFNGAFFRGLKGKINLLNNRICLHYIYKKFGNIIGISSLLSDFYAKYGCNTVTIPTIVDTQEYTSVTQQKNQHPEIKIAYAGTPWRKDYIGNAILALSLLPEEERKHIQLHFYGPEKGGLKNLGFDKGFLEQYDENIICHGRIPHSQVKEKIADADFTVLLRPNKRYANAGFPTKVGESMACGTPVIANLTSDLGRYILDGQTGIVCRDESPEACAEAYRKAVNLTWEQRLTMNANCLQMAKKAFDYRSYTGAMEQFLDKL